MLRKNFFSIEQLRAITVDFHTAGLDPAEVVMMDYAQQVSLHADEVTEDDIQKLRDHGFGDDDILDIALAAAARCFFSKALCAIGAQPNEAYGELAEALDDILPPDHPS